MTSIVSTYKNIKQQASKAQEPIKPKTDEREYLNLSMREWMLPLGFLLSMSMTGLEFPLGYFLIIIFLINRWQKDRYDFTIMLWLVSMGWAFLGVDNILLRFFDKALLITALAGIFLYRKPPIVRKALYIWLAYALVLFVIAMLSEETLRIQFTKYKNGLLFVTFIVPFMIFGNRDFDIKIFFRRLMPYAIIICIFYIIDCFIFNGFVLVPNTHGWDEAPSRFYNLVWNPFSTDWYRKMPGAIVFIGLCVWPVLKFYKLRKWQWAVVALALVAARTFTIISGLIFVYILFQGKLKRFLGYAMAGITILTTLYFVDGALGVEKENGDSAMRIYSSINQIINFTDARDEEDASKLASGRLAQALPKIEMLYDMNRQWIGFGYLDPEKTTMTKYIIVNEYIDNPDEREMVATNVETAIVQVFLDAGYIGVIAILLFYFMLWWIVRKLKYGNYFASMVVIIFWFSVGGMLPMNAFYGQCTAALAFAVTVLASKKELPGFIIKAKRHITRT